MGEWWASAAWWPQRSLATQKKKRWDRGRAIRCPRGSRGKGELPDGWGHERLRSSSYRGQGISYWEQEDVNSEGSQPKHSGQVMCNSMLPSQKGWWDPAQQGGEMGDGQKASAKLSQLSAVVQAPVWYVPQDQCSWRKTSISESVCQKRRNFTGRSSSSTSCLLHGCAQPWVSRCLLQGARAHWAALMKVRPGYTTLGLRSHYLFLFFSMQQATFKPTNSI